MAIFVSRQGRFRRAGRKAANSLIALILGFTGFVTVVWIASHGLSEASLPPVVELAGLVGVLVASQVVYRGALGSYFREADLSWG